MLTLVEKISQYNIENLIGLLDQWKNIFIANIKRGDSVIIKPNWLSHSHKYDPNEWQSVITHPSIITAVLQTVLNCLQGEGRVIITDAPQTDSLWEKIMQRMTPQLWINMGRKAGIDVQILDLRDDEWINVGDVTVSRKKLSGDPLGSTECNLGSNSEFIKHKSTRKGYYGADYNKAETNEAHLNGIHKYKVSRTVIESDVFINLPKMKTHKKAGITCSLKNLVGINTYKNWLPHHNEGTPEEGGDQFPNACLKNKTELMFMGKFKSFLYQNPTLGKYFVFVKKIGKMAFGDTRNTIRSGNWYGNNTLWRTVLDLNKILFYANPDGILRTDNFTNRKKYITIVDGIIAGEGKGPEAPTPKESGFLVAGTNPVAVDCVCAKLMGFDWLKIPTLHNAFSIQNYPLCDFQYDDIQVSSTDDRYNKWLKEIENDDCLKFIPHFGWLNHIEL